MYIFSFCFRSQSGDHIHRRIPSFLVKILKNSTSRAILPYFLKKKSLENWRKVELVFRPNILFLSFEVSFLRNFAKCFWKHWDFD